MHAGRDRRDRAVGAVRWWVALLVGVASITAACRTDREVTRPAPEPVTAEALDAALLTEEDVAGDFGLAAEAATTGTELVPEHACDDGLNSLAPKLSSAAVFRTGGVRLIHSVAWFPGAGGAVEAQVRGVAEACSEVVMAEAGLALRTGELDFGVLSDDTLAVRFELEPTTGPITERDLIFMRRGDLISLVRLDGPRPSDKVLLDRVVRVAIGRLGKLAEDST